MGISMADKITYEKKIDGTIFNLVPYHPYQAQAFGRLALGPGATKREAEQTKSDFKSRGFRARAFQGENGKYYVYYANKKK